MQFAFDFVSCSVAEDAMNDEMFPKQRLVDHKASLPDDHEARKKKHLRNGSENLNPKRPKPSSFRPKVVASGPAPVFAMGSNAVSSSRSLSPPPLNGYGVNGAWKCGVCTYHNNESNVKCAMCGFTVHSQNDPQHHVVPSPSHPQQSVADKEKWQCTV